MNLKLGGFDINKKDPFGFTPLLLACKFKNEKAAEFLLCNVHQIKPSLSITDPEFFGYLPIHYICQHNGNKKLLNALLTAARENNELEKAINAKDSLGNDALRLALSSNKALAEFAQILINNGADINKPSVTGHTPLMMSLSTCEELIPWLIEKGASPNQTIQSQNQKYKYADDGTPVLHLACKDNKPNAVKLLLEKGADPNKIQENEFSYEETPLHIAARQTTDACITELLKSKLIKINAVNKGLNTALHEACASQNPNIDIIKKLVTNGAAINQKNAQDLTPFTLLCRHRFNKNIADIAKYLLKSGAVNSYQCLHSAALAPEIDKDMITFLLENGGNINQYDFSGSTILHKLVNRKHQIKIGYSDNKRALEHEMQQIDDAIEFLKSKGAIETHQNVAGNDVQALDLILKKEADRDHIIPRLKIKKKETYFWCDHEVEENDYTHYPLDSSIISQNRNGKQIFIKIENFGQFLMQPFSAPVVLYKKQDLKREKEDDIDHSFSLIVDNFIAAGLYVDCENQNDPLISNLLKSVGFKSLDEDKFAVILKGKIYYDKPCKDEKLIPKLLVKKGINGCFIYLFNKDKTCFHRKFNHLERKEDKAQFQKCFDDLKEQARNKIHIDPKKTPALLFSQYK